MPFAFNRHYLLKDEDGEARKTPVGGDMLGLGINVEVVKAAEMDRAFWIIASSETIDRDGDVIRAAGWDLRNFKKNPVMPFGHNYKLPPVGFFPKSKIEDRQLKQLAHFPEGMSQLSEEVYQAYLLKAMRAFSVGFGAIEIKDDEKLRVEYGLSEKRESWSDGILFWRQELWETSAVPVPSNPDAVAQIKAAGGNTEYIEEAFQHAEDFVITFDERVPCNATFQCEHGHDACEHCHFDKQPESDKPLCDKDCAGDCTCSSAVDIEIVEMDLDPDGTDDADGQVDNVDIEPNADDGDKEAVPVTLATIETEDGKEVVAVLNGEGIAIGYMTPEALTEVVRNGEVVIETIGTPEAIDLDSLSIDDFKAEPEPDTVDLSDIDPQDIREGVKVAIKEHVAGKVAASFKDTEAYMTGEIPQLKENES